MNPTHRRSPGLAPTAMLAAALTLGLPASLSAQDEAARTTTANSAPLTIHSSEIGLLAGLAAMLGGEVEPPRLADGEVATLTIDDGGRPILGKSSGSDFLELRARPATLAKLFPEALEYARAEAQGTIGEAIAMSGEDPTAILTIVELMLDLPAQIDSLHLRLPKHPEDALAVGLDLELEITPVADSQFAKFHAALHPTEKGVPALPFKDCWMQFQMDVDMERLGAFGTMLSELYLESLGLELGEDLRKTWKQSVEATTGAMSMGWSLERGLVAIIRGAEDVDFGSLIENESYQQLTRELIRAEGMEAEFSEEGSHRGAKIWKVAMRIPELVGLEEMIPFPMFENGTFVERFASIRGYTVMSMFGAGRETLLPILENIDDGRIERKPLGKLVSLSMKFTSMFAAIEESIGAPISEEMPESLDVSISRTATSIKLALTLR